MAKKSWRAWLERLVAAGPGAGGAGGQEEEEDGAGGGAGVSSEGGLMKAVRVLGARLLGLSDPPKAPIGYGRLFCVPPCVCSLLLSLDSWRLDGGGFCAITDLKTFALGLLARALSVWVSKAYSSVNRLYLAQTKF